MTSGRHSRPGSRFNDVHVCTLQHMFAFEYFAYTPIPEWGGKKLRIPIEDDAMLMTTASSSCIRRITGC